MFQRTAGRRGLQLIKRDCISAFQKGFPNEDFSTCRRRKSKHSGAKMRVLQQKVVALVWLEAPEKKKIFALLQYLLPTRPLPEVSISP